MVSCIFIIRQVMELKISLTLWLVLLASVTQIGGVSVAWPLIETDVGDYPDTNTGPLRTDLNNVLSPDTVGPSGWTALHIAAGLNKPNMADVWIFKIPTVLHRSTLLPVPLDSVNVIKKLLPWPVVPQKLNAAESHGWTHCTLLLAWIIWPCL